MKVRFASGREEASLVVSGSGRGPRLELDLCVQLKHPGRRRRSTSRCVRTPTTNLCVLSLFTFRYLALVSLPHCYLVCSLCAGKSLGTHQVTRRAEIAVEGVDLFCQATPVRPVCATGQTGVSLSRT